MSILFESEIGYFINHDRYITHCYENIDDEGVSKKYKLTTDLFEITVPYKSETYSKKTRKRKKTQISANNSSEYEELLQEIKHVENLYSTFYNRLCSDNVLPKSPSEQIDTKLALKKAESIYDTTGQFLISNAFGENKVAAIKTINSNKYLFPDNCRFFCKDVSDIKNHITEKFDVIILDPPWWNKYIRRKKSKSSHGYKMLHTDNLRDIPVNDLLNENGLVVVWCTNSQQQFNSLKNDVFDKWNVKYLGKWFWLKVTKFGETVCPFSEPNGKQPFERIIFAGNQESSFEFFKKDKIVVSVPSALHSHKPPLLDLIKRYFPENFKCLEIFARYLLPQCTSYGLEALKFQHICLYEELK